MNELYRLPPSQHRAGLHAALPHLSLVRSEVHPAHRDDAGAADQRAQQATNQSAGRLAGSWTQRDGDTPVGGWVRGAARANWPGRAAGIRAPETGETYLSAAEVMHALKIKLITDADDEIDCAPMVRIYRPAGAWVSAAPGARRAGLFDGLVTA